MLPRSMEDLEKQTLANSKVTGFMLETAQHIPCPWCAFKDFMVLYPFQGVVPDDDRPNIDAQMETERECRRCHRKGKSNVERDPNGVQFEFVQTGGPAAPKWFTNPPRFEIVKDG